MEALRQLLNSKDTSWMPADRDTSRSRISHTRTELSWESQPASASRTMKQLRRVRHTCCGPCTESLRS